jgi:hypothetical protein
VSDEALSATEIDLIRRTGKAVLLTFVFIVLAMKQSYFDYPIIALSCVIFAISLLNSTVSFSRVVIGYLLLLAIVPPQAAPIFKESISFFFSLIHN